MEDGTDRKECGAEGKGMKSLNNIRFITDIDCVRNGWIGGFSPQAKNYKIKVD